MMPEVDLVVRSLTALHNAEHGAAVQRQMQAGGFAWPRVLAWADQHRVVGNLAHVWFQLATDLLPEVVTRQLTEYSQRQQMLAVRQLKLVLELVDLLAAQDIPVIPYKGVILGKRLYGTVGVRHVGDIDLLVQPQDALKARELILAHGEYRESSLTANQTPTGRARYAALFSTFSFENARYRETVELQWAITQRHLAIPADRAALYQNVIQTNYGTAGIHEFDTETLLVVLAVHAMKHNWSRLAWLLDVVQLVHTQRPEWQRVWQIAEAWRCRRIVATTLALVDEVFECDLRPAIPPAVVIPERIVRNAAASVTAPAVSPFRQSRATQFALYWRMRERLPERLRVLHLLGLKGPDLAFADLPQGWQGLYWLIRPLRGFGKLLGRTRQVSGGQ